MVAILEAQVPVTPAGNPLKLAPVAPLAVMVILAMAVLMHFVCAIEPAEEVRVALLIAERVTTEATLSALVPSPTEAMTE